MLTRLMLVSVLLTSPLFALTEFYVDPDFTGTHNGAAATPWQALTDSGAWTAINAALATGPVTVYFSARNASSDTNEASTVELVVQRSDTSANVLTLDGISKYNTNDTTPSWTPYITPTTSNWRAASKFQITSAVPFDSNSTGAPCRTAITLQGFRLISTNGQILNGAYIQNFTAQFVEGSRNAGGSGGPGAFIGPANAGVGCGGAGVNNVTFQNNYIHNTWGECLYIGASTPDPPGSGNAATGDNYLIQGNQFDSCATAGGQGDGIDTKDGHTNLRLLNNIIRPSFGGGTAGSDGQGIAFESGTQIIGNYIEQPGHDGIAIFEGWNNNVGRGALTVANNIIVNVNSGVGHNGGIDNQTPGGACGAWACWSAIGIYNNSIFSTTDQCVEIESGNVTGAATVKNNIFDTCSGGGLSGGALIGAHDYNLYFNATGCTEAHSVCTNPQFISTVAPFVDTNFKLQFGSPAIGAGLNLSSLGIIPLDSDYAGVARPPVNSWDIGAYQIGGGPPPPPGTNFYVNVATGNDNNSVAQAQNPATPWQTIQKAVNSFTLGSTGTTIHVAGSTTPYGNAAPLSCAGYQPVVCVNRGGTSATARLTLQCDNAWSVPSGSGCLVRKTAGTNTLVGIATEANFVTVQDFDVSGSIFDLGLQAQCGGTTSGQCLWGNSVYFIHNYVHDVAQTANDGGTTGCPSAGAIQGGPAHATTAFMTDLRIQRNRISNYGLQSLQGSVNQCQGIYANNPRTIIQDNTISDIVGYGIHAYSYPCDEVITNNTVVRTGQSGIVVGGSDNCGTAGNNTIRNNISDNNLHFGIQMGPAGGSDPCTVSTPNLDATNILNGNGSGQVGQASSCTTVTPFPQLSEAATSTFVNYLGNSNDDYHLKNTSLAGANGALTCVSGGITPCVPSVDFDNANRPTSGAQSIGAYILVGSGVPVVSFSPSPLAFGTVPVSTPATLNDMLTNIGTASLTFSPATITGTNASVFVIVSTTCGSSLAGSASCSYTIRATPTATGLQTANLTLTDNASGSPHQLPLTVTGGTASLTANPTSLNFGVVAPGSCAAVQLTNMTNTGNVDVVLGGASITGTNATDFSFGGTGTCSTGTTLTAGNACADSIKFCPATSGAKSATLNQPSNAPTVTVALSGSGGTSTATLLPASFNYGNQQVGTSSLAHAFTYTNTGTLALAITNVTVNSTAYSVSDNCPRSPATLAPAATCTANLTFRPTAVGVASAVLTVTSGATQTSAVTGTGTQASIVLSPTTVAFGNVLVGTTSATTTVSITNNGTASATIGSVSAAAPFSTVNNTCGASLAATASCSVGVRFSPTATGLVSGQLIVADSAPGNPHTAALSGTGTAPVVALTPSSNAYGNQPVGTSTVPFNFTFTNSGTGPATISSVGIVGTNPSDFLIGTNTCAASPTFSDTFSTGVLDASKWVIDTGNSPAPGAGNTGTFATANVSLSQGMLDLMLTQVAGSPIVSTGAEVRSVNTFGYGTYTWLARAGSTATIPTGSGSVVSGQVTGLFNYFQNNGLTAPNFTEDDFEIEGQFPTQLEMTSWSSASPVVNTETNSTQAGMDTGFHQYTYIWAPGRIDYYFDGALVSTHTTNVPSSPAFVIQNFYGTNGTAFGGTATTGSVRHLYVSNFSYTPATNNPVVVTLSWTASVTSGVTNYNIYRGTSSGHEVRVATVGNVTTFNDSVLSGATYWYYVTAVDPSGESVPSGEVTATVPAAGASSLPAGTSCTIGVSFKPTVAGSRAATLQVIDSAVGSPHTSALTGTGTSLGITLSPSSLTFGNTTVGVPSATQAITLTNIGNITLNIASIVASGDFSRTTTCGATVAASGTCTITVTFTPTATGTRTGAITITDDANGSPQTVPLTGTGIAATAPTADISPSSLTFGNQVISTPSATQQLTLTNNGTASLTITSITASGDYSRTTGCGGSLATSTSCTVTVTFTPTALGLRSGAITFVDNAAGSPQVIPLSGTGVSAPAPQVSISPTSLTFASTTVGVTTAAQVLTLTNIGNATLNLASIVASGDYARTTNCGATVVAGANCTVNVTFTPTATGTRAGAITFTDDAAGSPQSIPLTGVGTAPTAPIVNFSPTSLTFASQTVNTTSTSQRVVLTNTGNAALNFTRVINGDYAIANTSTCSTSLAATTSCNFDITFTPTALGSRVGSLVLTDNAAGSPHSVQFTGTGVAPVVPAATFNPTSLTFSNQIVNTTSAGQVIMLTNTGNGSLAIASIVASGDFARTTTCGAALAAGSACNITVTFTPTAQGTRTGAIAVTDNAAGSPQMVPLTGTGVPAPQPAVTFSPTTLTFPNVFVGSSSTVQDVTLTNSGTGTLNIASIVASGDYSRTTTCGATLASLASCLIHVTFTPTAPGPRAGLISVTDDAPGSPQTVSLNGTGVATSPAVCLSPSSINFGNQPVSTTSGTQPIRVTNCGTANLIISSATASANFTAATACATVLPQATCTVNAAFAPGSAGTLTGTISIASNAASSPDVVTTSGFGTQAGTTISPTSVSFGTVTVGVQSSGHLLTLTNVGNVSLTVNTPTFTGANPTDFSFTGGCATLAVNGTCTYSVFATPGGAGARTGTFNQSFANGVTPVTVSLSVTGQAAAPAVTLTPAAIDFGSTTVGTSTPAQTITLTNSGTATLNVTSVTATGTNSGDVLLSADNCTGAAVVVGGLCTVSVRMVPGGTGARSANAHFITNAASSPDNTTLAVIGLAAPAPQATFTPTTLAFGNVRTNTTSASKTVTVGNIGNANLNITSITLGGANPSQYNQTNNCTVPVIPNSSCTVTVNFTPTTTGSKPATLVIVSDDPTNPTETITLTGTGKGHPKAVIGVTNISFGNTIVGTTSGPAAFTITNVGDATLNVGTLTTAGDTFLQSNTCTCCPVVPNTSCSVSVQFNPQVLCGQFDPNNPNLCISNNHLGSLAIPNDGDTGTQTVALMGTALPVPPPPGPITITLGGVAKVGGSLIVGVQ